MHFGQPDWLPDGTGLLNVSSCMYGFTFLFKNLTIEFSLEIIGCILPSLIVISVKKNCI